MGIGRWWSCRIVVITGESGAEPLRKFFLGGATGVMACVPLGGKVGLAVCCVEAAAVEVAVIAVAGLDKAFLTWVVRRGCR